MKKLVLTLLFVAVGITLSAALVTKGRIDLSGKMTLKPGKASAKSHVKNITWGAKEKRKMQLTAGSGVLSAEKWTKVSFSFTPEADGVVNIRLMSNWSRSKGKKDINAHWVLYDKITVEGSKIINGDFEKAQKGKPIGWYCKKINYITSDGNAMVKVWHNECCSQSIKVKKDQEVSITYFAKADKIEEAKK